jgi:hypothetical protein
VLSEKVMKIPLLKEREGQVMIVAALFLIVIAVFVLTHINITRAVDSKIRLQTAADAAAKSGAVWQARCYNQIAVLNTAGQQAERCFHIINYYRKHDAVKKALHYEDRIIIGAVGVVTGFEPIVKFAAKYQEPRFKRTEAMFLQNRANGFNKLTQIVALVNRDFIQQEVFRTACINITNGMDRLAKLEVKRGSIKRIPRPYGALIMDQHNRFDLNAANRPYTVKRAKRLKKYGLSSFIDIAETMEKQHERRRKSFTLENKQFTVLAWDKSPRRIMGRNFFFWMDNRNKRYTLAGSAVSYPSKPPGDIYLDIPLVPTMPPPFSFPFTRIKGIEYFLPDWHARLCPVKTSGVQLKKFSDYIKIKDIDKEYESYSKILRH